MKTYNLLQDSKGKWQIVDHKTEDRVTTQSITQYLKALNKKATKVVINNENTNQEDV